MEPNKLQDFVSKTNGFDNLKILKDFFLELS